MSESNRPIDEQRRERFETAWIQGRPIPIDECLPPRDADSFLGTLEELAIIEMEFAWKAHQAADSGDATRRPPRLVEEYLSAYPELASSQAVRQNLIEQEFYIRAHAGAPGSVEDYHRRFPEFGERLELEGQPETAPPSSIPAAAWQVGSTVGHFRLVEEIGQGGMGSVFVAEQQRPVRRQVALKVIRRGMQSKDVLARFDAERQALALMDHPNIARILDGGSTADGQPYFVMELVRGVPLTEYCDQQQLGLGDRLKLFVDVCSAVQHAHQKGVIHRDLKPSNILVGEYDGKPVAKVIDFGLAKALDSEKLLTDKTMATHLGQVLGTFRYMSPEQAAADSLDIDTRTDIYALGVILYELLTGSTPLDEDTLRGQAMLGVLELIRDHEPPRPSDKLSSTQETASTVSQRRRTDPQRLSSVLRGDLDWVVMKAIEKDRRRRYDSAGSFADDIIRYLKHDPVVARPPSAAYRFKKSFRKHRVAVLSAIGFVVLLLIGIAGTSYGLWQANRQTTRAEKALESAVEARNDEAEARREADERREEAEQRRQEADDARKFAQQQEEIAKTQQAAAEAAEAKARQSLARTRRVLDFVVGSFRRTDPAVDGRLITIASVLEEAMDQLKDQLEDDPLEKTTILDALGRSFTGLGIHDLAIEAHQQGVAVAESAWGLENSRYRAIALNNLAYAHQDNGDLKRSHELFEQTLAAYQDAYGPEDPRTIDVMSSVAASAALIGQLSRSVELMEQTYQLQQRVSGKDDPATLKTLVHLVQTYREAGVTDKQLEAAGKVVAMAESRYGKDSADCLSPYHNYAVALEDAGQLEESLAYRRRAWELSKQENGPQDPTTIRLQGFLAKSLGLAGQHEAALKLFREQIEISRERYGDDHEQTLIQLSNMASYLSSTGDLSAALPLREEAYRAAEGRLGPNHPTTLVLLNNYALNMRNVGRYPAALPLMRASLERRQQKYGEDHSSSIDAQANLAHSLTMANELEEAIPLFQAVLAGQLARFEPTHSLVLRSRRDLGRAYSLAGRHEEAIGELTPTVKAAETELGPDHPETLEALTYLANARGRQGDWNLAIEQLDQVLQRQREAGNRGLGEIKTGLHRIRALGQAGRLAEATSQATALQEKVTQTWGAEHAMMTTILLYLQHVQELQGQWASALQSSLLAFDEPGAELASGGRLQLQAQWSRLRLRLLLGEDEPARQLVRELETLLEDPNEELADWLAPHERRQLQQAVLVNQMVLELRSGQAQAAMERLTSVVDNIAISEQPDPLSQALVECWLAVAESKTGQTDDAQMRLADAANVVGVGAAEVTALTRALITKAIEEEADRLVQAGQSQVAEHWAQQLEMLRQRFAEVPTPYFDLHGVIRFDR